MSEHVPSRVSAGAQIGLARKRFQGASRWLRGALFVAGFIAICAWTARAFAEPEALIVVGIAGDESDAEHFQTLAERTAKLLAERGLRAKNVAVLSPGGGAKVTRERILAALGAAGGRVPAGEEFWLVLYGHAGRSSSGTPAFQVSGPRLTAEDLQQGLKAITARQNVFLGTESSGAFLPFLAHPNCTALAATAGSGEVNQPRFPEQWVEALAENPKAPFAALAARAAQRIEEQYQQLGLAQGEHARLFDPGTQKILQAPFGVADVAAAMGAPGAARVAAAAVKPSDIEAPKDSPDPQFKKVEATEETRRIMAAAKTVANPEQFPAIMLRQELGYTVNADRTTSATTLLQVYLARDDAGDDWANFRFSSQAGSEVTRITGARTILPDGSSLVFDVAQARAAPLNEGFGGQSYQTLFLPNAVAGCVVEISYRTDAQPPGDIPAFYKELELQRPIPVLQTGVTLKLPRKQALRYVLKNSSATPQETATEHSKVLTWNLVNLPAYEPLPLDPPKREVAVWLGISSLHSWDEFEVWFRRIARDSEIGDATIARKAAELASGKKTARDKIQAAFEFVSSLRYVAIEFGINAFRPRTPATVLRNRYGDCKDKANLLVALLREMEVPAHFVLINRGSSTDPAFPGWQFNHAIACVPSASDLGISAPLWLDSTDTTTPFGTVAPGNVGRSALVFEKERAIFKDVTLPASEITRITDTWVGEQTREGSWQGSADQVWTGLADYGKRGTIGALSPAQRVFTFSQWLDQTMPRADFSGFHVSSVSDLTVPMRLQSRWKSGGAVRLNSGLDLGKFLAAPARNRPMVINDGQPLEYRQTLRLTFSNAGESREPPPDFRIEAAGAKFSIQSRRLAERTMERVAACEIRVPRIPVENYAAFRAAFRDWSSRVAEPFNP